VEALVLEGVEEALALGAADPRGEADLVAAVEAHAGGVAGVLALGGERREVVALVVEEVEAGGRHRSALETGEAAVVLVADRVHVVDQRLGDALGQVGEDLVVA
jgi:hypothetical protein